MAEWHHYGCELGQTSEDGKGQGGLACCSPWGCKELDVTGEASAYDIVRNGSKKSPPPKDKMKSG